MTPRAPRVVAVMTDLMLLSRIDAAVTGADGSLRRVDGPSAIGEADLILVDWSARAVAWPEELAAWRATHPAARVILFGRHTDLESHAAARAAGAGPMWARSKLVAELPRLLMPVV
jgi:hypothetical protein